MTPALDDELRSLRGRFGPQVVARLLRGDDDDRLRGIARAASDGSAEAVALLTQLQDTGLRSDPRAPIELARALASFSDQDAARAKLVAMVGAPAGLGGRRGDDATGDSDPVSRIELARAIAAMALAGSGQAKAVDELVRVSKTGGPGQAAAIAALVASGVSPYASNPEPPSSALSARYYGDSGDLRLLDALATAQARATDAPTRSAALLALANAGDQRALPAAKVMMGEQQDARLREAAAEAMTLLDAPERFHAVEVLLADAATASVGVRLAERVQDANVVHALMARMALLPPAERDSVVVALGHGRLDDALKALVSLLPDARLGPAAAHAIARSPHPGAMAAIEKIGDRRLAVRAYVLRRALRGETSGTMEGVVASLAASKDARDRAMAAMAAVAADASSLPRLLDDADPRVRRMAAMGARASGDARTEAVLLAALAKEKDEPTRVVLSAALRGGDPEGTVPTLVLVDRAEGAGPDAPLAVTALTVRATDDDEALKKKLDAFLASRDPLVRAYAARGLARSSVRDATGRLASAYRYEADVLVRRSIVFALAARRGDESAPARAQTLDYAARLDPDSVVRLAAKRTLASLPVTPDPVVREAAWLRVVAPEGSVMPQNLAASYVAADGTVAPLVFDDDGFALVLGVAPGEGRLILAPRVP